MAQLASLQITSAAAGQVTDPVTGFGKPQAATITARFTYVASAATSVKAYVQTSVDGGATWWDIACFAYTASSANEYVNVGGLKEVNTPVALADGSLADDSSINGLLGDRFRVKYTSTGTYGAGTALRIDIETR